MFGGRQSKNRSQTMQFDMRLCAEHLALASQPVGQSCHNSALVKAGMHFNGHKQQALLQSVMLLC